MTYRDLTFQHRDLQLDASGDLALESGTAVIGTDLTVRLGSPKGSHWAWPQEGTDLSIYINATADPLTLLALRQDVELEVVKDVRVLDASATVTTSDLRSGRVDVAVEFTDATLTTLGLDVTRLLRGGAS